MNNLVDQKRRNAINLINTIVKCTIKMNFKIEETVDRIKLKNSPTIEDWLRIALNLQIKIVNDDSIQDYITNNLNIENLSNWDFLLRFPLDSLIFISDACGYKFPREELIPIAVIYAIDIKLDLFLRYLDNQFENDFFPNLTFEDAIMIVFRKVDLPHYAYRLLINCNKDISKYIKYLSFVMKIFFEKIRNIKINPFSKQSNIEIKTNSASENILLFLNSNYNTFVQ